MNCTSDRGCLPPVSRLQPARHRARSLVCLVAAALASGTAPAEEVFWLGGTGAWSQAGWVTPSFALSGPSGPDFDAFVDGIAPDVQSDLRLDMDVELRSLTVSAGDTLRGSGLLLADRIVNRGTIHADALDAPLTLDRRKFFPAQVGQATWSFDNGGGRIRVQDGASLHLSGELGSSRYVVSFAQPTVSGGVLQGGQNSAAFIRLSSRPRPTGQWREALTFADIELAGQLQIEAPFALQGARISGHVTTSRTAPTFVTSYVVDAGGTLEVRGALGAPLLATEITMNGLGSTVLDGATVQVAGMLTVGEGHTLRSDGAINAWRMVNKGTVYADKLGIRLTVSDNSQGPAIDNSAGRFIVANGAELQLLTHPRATYIVGGTLEGLGKDARLDASLSHVTFEGVARADKLRVAGRLTNNGELTVTGDLWTDDDVTFAGTGRTILRDSLVRIEGSAVTIATGHTFGGAAHLASDAGRITMVNQGTIVADGLLYIDLADNALANPGRIVIGPDGVLVVNTIQFEASSVLQFDVGTDPDGHARLGRLDHAGLRLQGELRLGLTGYAAQVGDSFAVLATYPGGDLVGMFDRVVAPGFTVASVYDAGGLTVTLTGVQAVPEPGTWALWLAGAALVGARARRRRQPA